MLLFLLALATILGVATFQDVPGYMDADYYYAGGLQIASGAGLSEPFLWNYLADPAGLPHPSHAYWMPLASFLAALGMKLSGQVSFWAGRAGFLILAAAIPGLTAALAYSLTRRKNQATLAGLLALFPAFYLPFLTTTDTFAIYMALGVVWFLVVNPTLHIHRSAFKVQRWFALGFLAGLMHLARADGILWLCLSLLAAVWHHFSPPAAPEQFGSPGSPVEVPGSRVVRVKHAALSGLLVLLGYLLLMAPWMARNWITFGSLLSAGGTRTLWLTHYDELFAYPASLLTPAHWWSSGLPAILQARLWSVGQDLQTTLAVQGLIFMAPLILLGLWRMRNDRRVKLALLAWLLTFLVMAVIFPYPGARGGFFHSGAALQPMWWAMAPVGLEAFLHWGERRRGWQPALAGRIFQAGLLALAALLTVFIVVTRVIGPDPAQPAWRASTARYLRLEEALQNAGARPGQVVLVNNPPGYFVANRRPAIYTPFGDEQTLLAAASRYQAAYLLLEYDHAAGLDALYADPAGHPGLDYLTTIEKTHIFRITGE